MKKRVALVAFNGEPMCFAHVLLNAMDMRAKGWDVKVIIEGTATRLVQEMNDPDKPFGELYIAVRDGGLIDCVCKACSAKMGSLAAAEAQGLPLCGEMKGHPGLGRYMEEGYEVITF
ncbi:DsrE family protein [bacterium]|nr:DsrE family protein [bacterium]